MTLTRAAGLIGGLIGQEASGIRGFGPWLAVGLGVGVVIGLPTGLIVGLLFGLLSGLQTQSYVTPPAPGKALQVSKQNALLIGLPVGAGLALIGGLGFGLGLGLIAGNKNDGVVLGLIAVIIGLAIGSIAGLQRGGGAYLRHHIPRWLLARTGFIPQHYVPFLDHATRLILLRRRGGGYEFVHRLLLQHFAALESHSWQARASPDVSQGLLETRSVDQQRPVVLPEAHPSRGPAPPGKSKGRA